MWDLWGAKLLWGRFSPSTLVSLSNHFTDGFTLIIIHYHPGVTASVV
jgi:hypothetical protein